MSELDDVKTEVVTNRLRWEEGSRLLVHHTNVETDTLSSRHLSQPEAGKMNLAVAVSATAANVCAGSVLASDTESFTSLSLSVPTGEAVVSA